jgi:ectoine hydroxylase-related dioxygenase (phytanoyl-CoA dioxygenase family)
MNVLTIWLAVDESDRENGCLRVVRGSHKQELGKLKDDLTTLNALGSYTHQDADIDQSQIVDIVLKPGGKDHQLFFCSISFLKISLP